MSGRTVLILGLCLILGCVIAVGWLWFSAAIVPADPEGKPQAFTISKGESSEQIASDLDRAGLIKSALAFRIVTALDGLSSGLQAGTYQLSAQDDLRAIARTLAGGSIDENELNVVLPEGLSNRELASVLAKKFGSANNTTNSGAGSSELEADFLDVFRGNDLTSVDFSFLGDRPSKATLEGYLFPDTYRFFKTATATEVRNKLLKTFDQKVPSDFRARSATIGRSFYDVLIMASILEKELTKPSDRRLAADLFWRRLDAGMALQSDATVNYVTGKSALQPSLDDTKVASPYNTYQNVGLPPGPIANPGRDAIEAALNPTPNEFWYYLTDPGGAAHFAKTYAEHVANKTKYLQ